MWRVGLLVSSLLFALAVAEPCRADKRVALVIGNSGYQFVPPLTNPKNDATDMAAALKSLGFDVIDGIDLDKAAFDRKVRDFGEALTDAQVGLFYYAGHGMQADGNNYLVPIDTDIKTVATLDSVMVRLDSIQRAMGREDNKTNIIFLDACRDNPLQSKLARSMGTRSLDVIGGLAEVEAGVGTLISFSVQPGGRALDGAGRNSPYTGALVKYIAASGDDLTSLLIRVRNDVLDATNNRQTTWENSSLRAKFYFVNEAVQQAEIPVVPAPEIPAQAALPQGDAAQAWQAAKEATNPAVFEAYIKRFGDSFYSDMAQARLDELQQNRKLAAVEPPTAPTAGAPPVMPTAPASPSVPLSPAVPAPISGAPKPGMKVLVRGDTAMTAFPGTKLTAESLPAGVNPVEKTFIDAGGPSLRVFDLSAVGAPVDQLLNASVKLELLAREIGLVFGLAFDDGRRNSGVPNLFAAATTKFGLQIVGPSADGTPARLAAGAPSAAFMEGQFGTRLGGGPGTVWKIDGRTGQAAVFANIALGGKTNSGPGLGDLAFDPVSGNLYVSDLDTGLIHRLDATGADRGQFDHGIAGRPTRGLGSVADDGKRMDIGSESFKPDNLATWGLTQKERRVEALSVHDGRLYYAVADGPEIWSVGLYPDGSFAAGARSELLASADQASPVTDIAFDIEGRMLVAQRGAQQNPFDYANFVDTGRGQVSRFAMEQPDDPKTPGIWGARNEEFGIGFTGGRHIGAGGLGLQYGYRQSGALDLQACGGSLISTGDLLRDASSNSDTRGAGAVTAIHGLELMRGALSRTGNDAKTASLFADFDGRYDDAAAHGHIGDVEAFHPCTGAEPAAIASSGSMTVASTGKIIAAVPPGARPLRLAPVVPKFFSPATQLASVRLEKKAIAAGCSGDTGGCEFKITLINTSPDPIVGSIAIDELMTAGSADMNGATITAEPSAPWICTRSPPFSCTHPWPLSAGARVPLKLTFHPGQTGPETELNNCVTLRTASLSKVPDGRRSDDSPWRQCAVIPMKPQKPACFGGMRLTSSGRCECPPGTNWDQDRCVVEEASCPPGTVGEPPDCHTPRKQKAAEPEERERPQKRTCENGGTYPNCCDDGEYYSRGKCRRAEATKKEKPSHDCRRGWEYRDGTCRYVKREPGYKGPSQNDAAKAIVGGLLLYGILKGIKGNKSHHNYPPKGGGYNSSDE